MMQFYLVHPRHGKKIAYQDKEAEADKKNGWKEVKEAEFYYSAPAGDGIEESPTEKPKRGRPPKTDTVNDTSTT